MTDAESLGTRPNPEPSLFSTADLLDQAVSSDPASPGWYAGVHSALRKSTLAVEYQLDNLASQDGLGAFATEEPRLGPALDRLEQEFAALLLQVWSAEHSTGQPSPDFVARLKSVSSMLRKTGAHEFDFVHDAYNPTGAPD
jgi:hypothetical protein